MQIPQLNLQKVKLKSLSRNHPSLLENNKEENSLSSRTKTHSRPLSNTFRSYRLKATVSEKDNSIYRNDLDQTLKLNIELASKLLQSQVTKVRLKSIISLKISKILEFIIKRKKLKQKKDEFNAKYLLSKQIYEQVKKEYNDNFENVYNKVKELTEKLHNKKKYLTSYARNFNDIENYVHRESLNDTHWEKKFYEFEIQKFLFSNEYLVLRKKELSGYLLEAKKMMNIISAENSLLFQKVNISQRTQSPSIKFNHKDKVKAMAIQKNKILENKVERLKKILYVLTYWNEENKIKNEYKKDVNYKIETILESSETVSNYFNSKSNVQNVQSSMWSLYKFQNNNYIFEDNLSIIDKIN